MAFSMTSASWWFSMALVFLLASAAAPEPQLAAAEKEAKAVKRWLYVGTYTGGPSKGIYRFEMEPATGKLTARALAATTANPSFLAIHPNHRFLYAVGELEDFGGKKSGAVS